MNKVPIMKTISFILFAFLCQNAIAGGDSTKTAPILKLGEKAPMFYLKTVDGEKFFLKDYCGTPREFVRTPRKNVILSFWASWCGPCKKEIPELEILAEKYKSDDLAIFLIDVGDDVETTQKLIQERGYKIPVITDENGVAANKYCPKDGDRVILPTMAFIGKDGNLIHIKSGYTEGDMEAFEEILRQSLAAK